MSVPTKEQFQALLRLARYLKSAPTKDFQVQLSKPISLFCDNLVVIHISKNPIFHEQTKYIEIDCHLVRDNVCSNFLHTMHVAVIDQLADVFTKPLSKEHFTTMRIKLGVRNLHVAV